MVKKIVEGILVMTIVPIVVGIPSLFLLYGIVAAIYTFSLSFSAVLYVAMIPILIGTILLGAAVMGFKLKATKEDWEYEEWRTKQIGW